MEAAGGEQNAGLVSICSVLGLVSLFVQLVDKHHADDALIFGDQDTDLFKVTFAGEAQGLLAGRLRRRPSPDREPQGESRADIP